MVFVEGYALNCACGATAQSSIETLKQETISPRQLNDGNRYYFLKEQATTDYYQQIEKIANEAIKDANLSKEEIASLGLFIGTSSPKLPLYECYLRGESKEESSLYVTELTQTLSEALKINGFRTLISTACTSSANALVQAKEMIESGLIDKALVVGVELYNELSIKGFDAFLLLSRDKIRPFDANRDGVILGEGLSAVVLGKKETTMELSAATVMLDTNAITSPTASSLKEIMQTTIQQKELNPSDLVMVKAHATATLHNDDVEADALNELFGEKRPFISSFKPYLGHTMGACGTNELVLLMESLKQGFIPKTINFNQEDPQHRLTPLLHEEQAQKGYYLLNYFGFGGNNCCLLLNFKGVK